MVDCRFFPALIFGASKLLKVILYKFIRHPSQKLSWKTAPPFLAGQSSTKIKFQQGASDFTITILALLSQPEQPNFVRVSSTFQSYYLQTIYSFYLQSQHKKPLHPFSLLHYLHSRSTIKLTSSTLYSASKFTDSGISVPLLPTFYQDLISHSVSPCDKRTSAPLETRLCHLSDQLTLTCEDWLRVFGY